MALTYDPTAMQNGYVESFFSDFTNYHFQRLSYIDSQSLPSICKTKNLLKVNLFMSIYQTDNFHSSAKMNTLDSYENMHKCNYMQMSKSVQTVTGHAGH